MLAAVALCADRNLCPLDERRGYQGLKPGDLVLVGRIILVKMTE